jgi:hypothetical protein
MANLEQRSALIAAAHSYLSDAIRHLDMATTHGDELDRLWLAGVMRQLCEARQPLSDHLDVLDACR